MSQWILSIVCKLILNNLITNLLHIILSFQLKWFKSILILTFSFSYTLFISLQIFNIYNSFVHQWHLNVFSGKKKKKYSKNYSLLLNFKCPDFIFWFLILVVYLLAPFILCFFLLFCFSSKSPLQKDFLDPSIKNICLPTPAVLSTEGFK